MTHRFSIPTILSMLLIFVSCSSQQTTKEHSQTPVEELVTIVSNKAEPHQYGGWYCPDNFGFAPVDIQKLDEVPAIAGRLPTQQELRENKSLIAVDTAKYPDARALEMDLPRVARIYSGHSGMNELIIVIQAIIVSQDTIVGYRFPNGGNGSARLSEVTFLPEDEVAGMGSQPFYYSRLVLKASKEDIWKAITRTDYFQQLGEKFDKQDFFSSEWTSGSEAHLKLGTDGEQATGYVGTVYGNAYLHIDYDRDGFHYSEKLLLIENQEDRTTEFFFASGPYPKDFEKQKSKWDSWFKAVKKASEAG
ncbi:MAG: hypothetical protein KDD02_07010 [Phaeodactylibacter sp.]|nr:hypothetical protein [Phaeodactylibacter sp.]MCB9301392.1 hypothetical protein [Lewinellaceae bacterium]